MTSVSASEPRLDLLGLVRSAKRRIRMFTPRGTFAETCAFFIGVDRAATHPFLDGFQVWMGARHSGRPQLAFWMQVLSEIGVAGDQELSPTEDQQAVETLL